MPHLPDRPPHILETAPALPLPPLNLSCSSGFVKGTVDVRWSLPTDLTANTAFSIVGVNVYRSFDSEFGPWTRLNSVPVGSGFYRDRTDVVLAMQEDVSSSFTTRSGTDPDGRWTFTVRNRPIHLEGQEWMLNVTNANVYVTVDGVPAFVESIDAFRGEVRLRDYPTVNPTNMRLEPPVVPGPGSVVLATYKYVANEVRTNLGRRIFYRVTTVAVDDSAGLVETPLERASSVSNHEVERLDYIWREAVRRNRYILDQGGERVKLFIQKSVGHRCGCWVPSHGQAAKDCPGCFGTGVLGGYDGPYDITVAPDDGEKAVSQGNRGRTLSHSYDTWTGPSPLLSQRDFVVKLNGDRYAIGPVRSPSNRGMVLQQFFTMSHIDESDIRYSVPLPDPSRLSAPRTRYAVPGGSGSTPMMTEREAVPDEREFRSNTVTGENHNRG